MRKVYILIALSLVSFTGFGQVNNGLMTTLSAVAGMRDRLPIEKLYLQLDKPFYALGDTLRFKAYLMNAQDNTPAVTSGNLHVELISPDAKIISSELIRLDKGLGNGDFSLPDTIPAGKYRLRAYTNWMRNFGDNFVFEKEITLLKMDAAAVTVAPKNNGKSTTLATKKTATKTCYYL